MFKLYEMTTPKIFDCFQRTKEVYTALVRRIKKLKFKPGIFFLFYFFSFFSHRCDNRATGEKCLSASCYRSCLSSGTGR